MQQAKKRQKKMTIETLLGDLEMALPVANYMHSTGRFKDKSGELMQTQNIHTMQETHNR
jgi:hypothetical protein